MLYRLWVCTPSVEGYYNSMPSENSQIVEKPSNFILISSMGFVSGNPYIATFFVARSEAHFDSYIPSVTTANYATTRACM